MPRRQPVDLASHLNANVLRGHPADFPIALKPMSYVGEEGHQDIPRRRAIVRTDTGQAIAVVSDRYALVPHSRILEVVEQAIAPIDVGPVQRGIYVDCNGARMRALFKFPALAQPVLGEDTVCPCLQVRNTYDGSARIALHIGAFRFVCTNLAVGGGGVFAGGFVSIHAGEIPIEKMADQLTAYLTRFDAIIAMYRQWSLQRVEQEDMRFVVGQSLDGRFEKLQHRLLQQASTNVFDAYNHLTFEATHRMRSARTAFAMLERINAAFQKRFPAVVCDVEEQEVVDA